MLERIESGQWNGTYAKLLTGICKLVLVENNVGAAGIAILTIGKHGATDGFNTCFIDVVATVSGTDTAKTLDVGLKCVMKVAKDNKCDGVLGDTPNKKLADMAKSIGFHVTPMYKLGRKIDG